MTKRTCTIDGCESKHEARGWCIKHYTRWRQHGDVDSLNGTPVGEPLAYFHAHIGDETDDCILWPYGQTCGYGQLWMAGCHHKVHILACSRFHGPKPDGHEVCHSCRNRHCFNPRHLRWGTHAENMADMISDGTSTSGERSPMSKLTWAEVSSIRASYATGMVTQRELGEQYGVCRSMIGNVVTGTHWIELAS